MFATGMTMGLAEWITDDTCLVLIILQLILHLMMSGTSIQTQVLLEKYSIVISSYLGHLNGS